MAAAPGFAPRLAALIGGPVAKEAPAGPVLRPAAGPVVREGRAVEVSADEPAAAVPTPAKAAVAEAKVVPAAPKVGTPEPVPLARQEVARDRAEPRTVPRPDTARPVVPEGQAVFQPPVPVAPVPVTPPSAVVPVAAPGLGDQRPTGSGPAVTPLPQPVRRTVALDLPPVVAAPLPPERPQRQPAPLLPADPERLAATAARLGVSPAKPAVPPVPADPPEATVKPAPLAAPVVTAEARPPMPLAARPVAEAPPEPVGPVASKPGAVPEVGVKPEPKAKAPEAPSQPALRPADPAREALPSQPPRIEPKVRVEIGQVTLVTREVKEGGAPLPRKSSLAPVPRRAGRGHSIPRPGGL